ncbi:MAG: hypothetical protein M3305_07720 [Actinomycetota bacterium]|nr:hypothetical protein [Actinomycetota bacterium]
MMTEEVRHITPEQFEESESERQQVIREFLDEYMEKRGIENLEELHRRFLETEHAYIPVPGLHRGKPVSFEVFERVAYGGGHGLYRAFVWGMMEVLDLEPYTDEGNDFALTYTIGERWKA